ncbi:MAG: energy transducer TonB [Bacteroidota bacterium]
MIDTPFLKVLVVLMATMWLVGCAKQVHTETPPDRIEVGGNSEANPEKVAEGYVDLEYVVNEQGVVEHPVVLGSTNPLFEPAAIKAVLKFKYKPRVVDGHPVAVSGVRTRITFELDNETEKVEQE